MLLNNTISYVVKVFYIKGTSKNYIFHTRVIAGLTRNLLIFRRC